MPPRRSHKKSKAGCQRCKQRKIKCDEVHPTCGNCSKHGVACDFSRGPFTPDTPGSASPPLLSTQSSSGTTTSSASTPPPNPAVMYQNPTELVRANFSPAASRLLELKLMHHFTAQTSQTFSEMAAVKVAWQVEIPGIAYDSQYLMDAILAVSALHMRSLCPNDQALIRASHGYMASALAQYSSLLNCGPSEMNAEALFSTSALIAFQASASRKFEDFQGEGGYTLPLAWFHSFQGVKTVVMASWQWLRKSNRISPIINGQPALFLDLDPQRRLFFAPLLEGVEEQVKCLPEQARIETMQAYEHGVAFLNWSHARPIRSRILGFAATVSRRFVELLSQRDPRTLVMVSCFFALTRAVDDVWWLQGVAKREVNGLLNFLPSEWCDRMEWALRVANHEGPLDEETWGGILGGFVAEDELASNGGIGVTNHIDILAQMVEEYHMVVPPD